jgi:site-specific DNA-methyltransferase (adenine-specific)/adenine-specific DNA-methyltransferase
MARQDKGSYDLSEAEQRDLVTLIQQGKPLPEKYRFILFEDKREVELVWNGKTRDVCTTVLPFQTLEHVDEPRVETKMQEDLFDSRGRQQRGWTNKLIWGDNKLILSSLKAGALRQQVEDAGGLKLIYIDPPFDVGADFSMDIEIGGETFHKEANLLEQIAYRDTWGRGADSFISMMYERLILMHELLAPDGSIYVHCDWRVTQFLRSILDEVFGRNAFVNEVIWSTPGGGASGKRFSRKHYTILFYSRASEEGAWTFNTDAVRVEYETENVGPQTYHFETNKKKRPGFKEGFTWTPNEDGKICPDVWTDIKALYGPSREILGYPTQKPEALLERILKASSNEGDLVADFFVGSGTTAAAAEKLGRKWIATDLGKFGIHTTRKRLIGVQRELKSADKPFRAFEVLNLGRYERQAYLNVGGRLTGKQKEQALARKEWEFRELILRAYKAQPLEGESFFHGKNAGRLVVVGPINLPVGRLFVEEVITECRKRGASRVDVLAFEFEMGLFPAVLEEAKGKGIDLTPKYIPAEVFDKRAVEKGQVVFHDISFVEATPRYDKKSKLKLRIELTDFSVYYTQGAAEAAIASLKNGKSDVVCEQGQLYKISKNKDGVVKKDRLTKHWTDWVDYWAVDFDYMSRKEIIRVPVGAGGDLAGSAAAAADAPVEFEERWTGGYIFENEWQSFRTRQNRMLDLTTVEHSYERPGRYLVAVKVIDIFGNDTMTLVPVVVG